SINMLARELQFVTLRDAFLYARDEKDVENLDLNDRVKRILKSRINEYLKWKSYSEKELRKRYNIEKSYLKSQINSLKHYTSWVKPYLIAAKKLGMSNFFTPSGGTNPNIVNIFNNMEIQLTLFGKKEFKPEQANRAYKGLKLENKYYSCIEVEIKFRTVPRATQSQQGLVYVHGGRTELKFKAYALNDKEINEINKLKVEEDLELIEGMTDVSLKEIQADIEHYLGKPEEEKEKKKEKIKFPSPFSGLKEGFKQVFKPLGGAVKTLTFRTGIDKSFQEEKIRDAAKKQAEALLYVVYDIYKKGHGMLVYS
ncbi:MAG: hypothetical protein AABX55_00665, partial [Nanoarchaeota archaeon]